MIACAFYTEGTPYEDEIKALVVSAEKVGIKLYTKGYQSQGTWERNCGLKPLFLMHCLETFDDNILYVDADAIFVQYPSYFDDLRDVDISVHKLRGVEVLSGTIWLRNCPEIKTFIAQWATDQQHAPEVWDQKVLQRLIDQRCTVRVNYHPEAYTKIFDRPGEQIIRHNQASRRFKKLFKSIPANGLFNGVKQRVRIAPNGKMFIVRKDLETERIMDAAFLRIPGELAWTHKAPENEVQLDFNGKHVYIIGKGPSLDELTIDDFEPDSVIICINESIRAIEKLNPPQTVYGFQQDSNLKNTCMPKLPTTVMICGSTCYAHYQGIVPTFVYTNAMIGMRGAGLTAVCAVHLAKAYGARRLTLYAFDALMDGGTCMYANSVGYSPRHYADPKRFKQFYLRIKTAIGNIPHEICWPRNHRSDVTGIA